MHSLWMSALTSLGAEFDAGRVARFAAGSTNHHTTLCDLSHLGVLEISGEDAATFLQGQLCNDVLGLDVGMAQWNGWCSPKGRLLTSVLLWRSATGYHLQLPRALLAAIQKRLQMYVLRAKVKLVDASDTTVRLGVVGSAANATIHAVFGAIAGTPLRVTTTESASVLSISALRFEVFTTVETALTLWNRLASHTTSRGAGPWDLAAIQEGVIDVLPETQDAFVPQMANFELIGGVSFKKGCYTGQEIVARTQYRGILKRRMVRVAGDNSALPKPGESVFSASFPDQAAGQIANVAASGAGFEALVVAQIEAIRNNNLRLEDGTALRVLTLPYEVTFPS